MNIVFISFIISFVCLAILLSVKFWENKTGRMIISKNFLHKSDAVLRRGLLRFFRYYFHISSKTADLPEVFEKVRLKIKSWFIRRRNKIVAKIIRALNINNIKDIERNKGSVSLFLKTISDDKKANR